MRNDLETCKQVYLCGGGGSCEVSWGRENQRWEEDAEARTRKGRFPKSVAED